MGATMTESYHRAAREAEASRDKPTALIVNGWPVLLCHTEGGFRAVINRCTHASSSFDGGRVRRGSVMCPLHGARFDLASGKCQGGPHPSLRVFPLRSIDGWLEVAVPDRAPGPDEMPVSPS
jgi:nitrite reductase/ring-hydroxylating ferredoxin subunit